ncbi:DMT family transporter [Burkholderia ubonensis]|uniref:DMT family transporter n=1 Tax=Burkholderia ubonensis TaxID=101571 RepID=UPI000756E9D1|nr:DMT family transporter [Burkholderia ubonensis]KVT05090.1 multidrug DMT transporter permease [Burkholderia ubonensis]KVT12873.1 multidrug DMT transporter permease [Burkholderia ubonensis]KVT38803.1 multidrug DMT transporter permease [Burkholderia ubonensis]
MLSYVSAFVLLSALLHASWNAILHGNRDRFVSMTWMSIGIGCVAAVAVALLPLPAASALPFVIASGITHNFYNLGLVYAYRRGDLGVVYPIARGASPLLVATGAALVAGEMLGPAKIAGVCLVSAGIVTLAFQRGQLSRSSLVAALATGVMIALYTVIDGVGVRLSGNSVSYNAWTFLFYLALPPIFIARRGLRALKVPSIEISSSVAGGLVSIAAYGIVVWAMQFDAMGVVSAIRETSVVFAVIIGRIFLREELTAKRFLSCLVIAAGAICIGS